MTYKTTEKKFDDHFSKKTIKQMRADVNKEIQEHTVKNNSDVGLKIPGSNWQKFKNLITEINLTNQTSGSQIKIKKRKRNSTKTENSTQITKMNQQPKATANTKENEKKAKLRDDNSRQNTTINTNENRRQVKCGGSKQQRAITYSKENRNQVKLNTGLTKVVAMDCEMVGIGDGKENMIARISFVNRNGFCIYDKYVKPTEEVKDYRTAVSGIKPEHLKNGVDFKTVQKEVAEILRGRILVGHALHNDLAVLFLSHPHQFKRDTSTYKLFRKITKGRTPSLKKLASELLDIEIQTGEHDSVEDARTAMQLYNVFRKKWENDIRTKK